MRTLFVVNVEHVEASPFVVALLYDEAGELMDGMTVKGGDVNTALLTVKSLSTAHNIGLSEIWTSNTALYMESLSRPGVLATIKHPSDTRETRRHIEQSADILRELYAIEPIEPRREPPKWRAFLVSTLNTITNYVKGDYEYEV
ncbi:hypothetical protein [Paenibacillus sp. PL91]|uniref:hypothetical protein n=1 Tax=Paenibacillus sp. PL91 TaxID=2729538 RepID=UPI00145DC5B7|nr:hypothetical protein [Paenibacillus sp. PL91]MBC9199768.1 hypothetical protein [Paenibacillus sp. PL91]